jgi:MoaA/NifB/PqqE/SkfB family radical SAM enzyme
MANDTTRLAIRLLKNGIRFQYLKNTGKPGRPQALSLEITHECIARCIMCNIWQISRDVPNLPADQWVKLLSSDLFADLRELDITGGEPFIKKDLPDLFAGICELKKTSLKALKSIAVTTNGLLTEKVLTHTEKILPKLQKKNLELVMVCAMDAVGNIHDKIRNYKNAWLKVNETIEGLIKLKEKYPNLIIGLKTTILPINIDELENIARYAASKELFTIISPCIITKARYLNSDRVDRLVFSKEDIEKMTRFYQSEMFRWSYHTDTLVPYLKTGMMKKPCSCGFNYFFVRSNSDLFLCPLINHSIGNINETPVTELYLSEKASRFRRRVGHYPECRECTEPGLERYALPFEGFTYLSILLRMGKEKFLQLHRHMGLDKYFA